MPDRNCSQCGGGDVCGNDRNAAQAQDDAADALATARRNAIRPGVVLFKDIEQVSSCRGEPTADYLIAWYRTLGGSGYHTGFYGNTFQQDYDFPRAYCAAAAADPVFAASTVIDGNEPEPQLGAPSATIGPAQAPPWAPFVPACSAPSSTVVWQYGESVDAGNVTDVDQMQSGLAGLLRPDGGVT